MSQDPGCNESWMKWAEQGTGDGQKREEAALLLLSRADSEQVPLWGVYEREWGQGTGTVCLQHSTPCNAGLAFGPGE